MSIWRRAALYLVRALRVRLRGQPLDTEPPGTVEIRDPKTGELLAFSRPMTAAEIREAREQARPTYRPRRWLDRRT